MLGEPERRVLDALTARILPSDGGAGAHEARVVAFIDGQLAEGSLAPLAAGVVASARILDAAARAKHGAGFDALAASAQDALVTDFAEGRLAAKFPQRQAFRVIHMLTLEGFLADPHHGGNLGMVGWRAIGFAAPPLRTRDDHAGHAHHGGGG